MDSAAPVDDIQDFRALYDSAIRPELEALELRRRKAMDFLKVVGGIGLLLVIVVNIIPGNGPEGMLMLAGLAMCVISVIPVLKIGTEAKGVIVGALCKALGLQFQPNGFKPAALQQMQALRLLPAFDSERYEDRFTGSRRGCDFELCEADLDQGSGKSRTNVFKGQLFSVAFPRRFLGTTVVLRDAGWWNRFGRPKDLERVGLEDPHFEKIFEVTGSDQVEARAILTPDFMEKLLALEAVFEGTALRCAFAGGRVLIAVEGKDRFEIGDVFRNLVDYGRVQQVARDLEAVFGLIDSFVGRGSKGWQETT